VAQPLWQRQAAALRAECLYSSEVSMFRLSSRALPLLLGFGLLACSPALNWREVRPDGVNLVMLLPCKPDRAIKTVPLDGRDTVLSMTGCEAGGAMFALARADVGDASRAAQVLAQWQSLTLAHMRASQSVTQNAQVPGADALPQPVQVLARGSHPDGQAVEGRALYFARGSQLFQAVVYAPRVSSEAVETFFSSFKFP
jgi:hypothetical protein